MKKRLIIYGVNHYPPKGGTSRVVENLILQLKDKYDILIYCYRNPLAEDHIPGVKVEEFREWAQGSIGSLIYFFLSAVHILLFAKADLISAHKTDCALFFPLLRLRFKVVATSHEAPYKRDKWNSFQKVYFRLAEHLFIRWANVCTCISEPLTNYYQQRYKTQVRFIPNGINMLDDSAFDYEKAASFVPENVDLSEPFILFSARRLMATKGCHTMLKAMKAADYPGPVFITGELDGSAYLRKLKNLSEGLNVYFLGYVHPLSALLAFVRECEIFIFPSEVEGMSMMLLEVASAGKPVIASDIPENKQIFSDREVLYFVSKDPNDLTGRIQFALSNPALMKEMGLRAQQKVASNYLWSSIALYYDKVFNEVIDSSAINSLREKAL